MGAGVGGMLFTMLIGWTLDRYGYPPVFIAAGTIPLLAFVVLFVLLDARLDSRGASAPAPS
jgi:fucose permease